MLIQYTPISTLTPEQLTRLRALVSNMQLESFQHVVFDGLVISKNEILATFPQTEHKKPPGKQLNG